MSFVLTREEFSSWLGAVLRYKTAAILPQGMTWAFREHDPKLADMMLERQRLDERIVSYVAGRLDEREKRT